MSDRAVDAKQTLAPKFSSQEDESRLYNELEIVILNATGLPLGKNDEPPTSYIHFSLLGKTEKFTNPVVNSTNPVFNENFSFPMITNDEQIRLIQRSTLSLTVMDMKREDDDQDDRNGCIGAVQISLANFIANMGHTNDGFVIKDDRGDKMGVLNVIIRWKRSLRMQRELGPMALGVRCSFFLPLLLLMLIIITIFITIFTCYYQHIITTIYLSVSIIISI